MICNNHRGGSRSRYRIGVAFDFSANASIKGFASGEGIVGKDVRVDGDVLAPLSKGSIDKGTEAPLPSRNGFVYMRSGC